jgi:hypothetical protein
MPVVLSGTLGRILVGVVHQVVDSFVAFEGAVHHVQGAVASTFTTPAAHRR